MPGITILRADANASIQLLADAKEVLRELAADGNHRVNFYQPHPRILVCCSGYDGYPFTEKSVGNYRFYVEGDIYDRPSGDLDNLLSEVAMALDKGGAEGRERLGKWLSLRDGAFLIIAIQTVSGEAWALNDPSGYLPAYWSRDSGSTVCSRDLGFLSHPSRGRALDGEGAAAYLLFGFPLGRRTLIEGVQTLEPASLFSLHREDRTTPPTPLQAAIFGRYDENFVSPRKAAGQLVDCYLRCLADRVKRNDICLVSLSGGLDSRAVAAGLSRVGPSTRAVTYLDADGRAALDAECAEAVAGILGLRWKLYPLPPATTRDAYTVFRQKYAHCTLHISFMVSYYASLVNDYGSKVLIFTGDGGDKMLPGLEPTKRLNNLSDTVDYLIDKNGVWPMEQAARFTGLAEHSLRTFLEEHLAAYPEPGMAGKVVRFMIRERAGRMVFESEDRNRCHAPGQNPFFSQPFSRLAMTVPDQWKSNYVLYREFLNALHPRVADVPNANWRISLNRPAARLIFRLNRIGNRILPGNLQAYLKRRYRREAAIFPRQANLTQALARSCDAIGADDSGTLDWREIRRAKPATARQGYLLLSLAALEARLRGHPPPLADMSPLPLP